MKVSTIWDKSMPSVGTGLQVVYNTKEIITMEKGKVMGDILSRAATFMMDHTRIISSTASANFTSRKVVKSR